MSKSRPLSLICVAVIAIIPITAAYDVFASPVPAIDLTVSESVHISNAYTFGYEFTADKDFYVTALGRYDPPLSTDADGSYEVGIWGYRTRRFPWDR